MTTYPPAKTTDGVCARPGCDKKVPTGPPKSMPKSLRPMYMEALADEPYCSAPCCRTAFGVKRPELPVMSTTPRKSVTVPPTRLQRARLEVSDATRDAIDAGKRPLAGMCELCGDDVPVLDTLGRDVSSVRRFCSVEHQRRYHQIYKRQSAAAA